MIVVIIPCLMNVKLQLANLRIHYTKEAKGLTDKLDGAKPETFGSTNRLQTILRPNQEIKLNCL